MSLRRNPTAWVVVLFGLVLLAGVVAYNREELALRLDAWWVDALLEDYAATRDEHLARRLAKLLDEQRLDRATGDAVLTVLTEPIIHLRDGYRADRQAFVAWVRPHYIYFGKLGILNRVEVEPGVGLFVCSLNPENQLSRGTFTAFLAGDRPELSKPMPLGPRSATLSLTYQVAEKDTWNVIYESIQRHELRYEIVPPDGAEQVRLDTEPAHAPTVTLQPGTGAPWFMAWSEGSVTGGNVPTLRIATSTVPVCFRKEFVEDDGTVHPIEDDFDFVHQHVDDDPERFRDALTARFGYRRDPRNYKGVLRLIPDPERAYRDARLKAIWGEPIEVPIEFEIRRERQ